MKPHHFLPVAVLLLAACGVPRQTLTLAHAQAAVPAGDLSDAQVAAALRAQADQWQNFAALLAQRELGGILFVDQRFIARIQETAADAARLRALMDANQDDPAVRRELLAAYQKLWSQAETYLSDTPNP